MEHLRERLRTASLSNWEHWPTVRNLWPWFTALGLVVVLAVPWGIRAEERNLEESSREALAMAGIPVENITFTGRQATIRADLTSDQQVAAITALAEMGGVSRVTWEEASANFVPPTTTTVAATTTLPLEPGAAFTASVNGGTITLRGTVPTAETIKNLDDAATDIWGSNVVNQMFVDGAVLPHAWLGNVEDSISILATLISPQLSFDYEGATLTGGTLSQEALDLAVARLEEVLGPEIAIDNKLHISPLELPNVQLISPNEGATTIAGTVADAATRRFINIAINSTAEELETNGSLQVSETTADVYLVHRLDEVIRVLGNAKLWTLQFDGTSLGGTATGGKTFSGNRPMPSDTMGDLLALFSSFMEADPGLELKLEVHVAPRQSVDPEQLAADRAAAIGEQLVRLGVDPQRMTVAPGPGQGDLLRFMLTPAEN